MYLRCPGVVVRCLHCEAVLIRIVQQGERCWLDLSGLRTRATGGSKRRQTRTNALHHAGLSGIRSVRARIAP